MRFALLALLTPLCEPAVHAQLLSDFTPPSGAVPGFPPEEGAWRKRILTATSPDGLDFTRSNRVITDQANVPDLVSDDNGVLYLYYSGGTVGDRRNVIAVAVSSDQGK
ncbi:MAG TPA: hypothetical protein VL285_07235, partial [Bryobacteraceae bacterium]|nr:hypothetical protein [Bryobacteraceae bacterium]